MNPGVFDTFPEFKQACIDCGLPFAPSDLALAESYWKTLDFEQHQEAITGLYARRDSGEYAEQAYCPLPQNYLSKHLWKRPVRIKATKQSRIDKFWEAV